MKKIICILINLCIAMVSLTGCNIRKSSINEKLTENAIKEITELVSSDKFYFKGTTEVKKNSDNNSRKTETYYKNGNRCLIILQTGTIDDDPTKILTIDNVVYYICDAKKIAVISNGYNMKLLDSLKTWCSNWLPTKAKYFMTKTVEENGQKLSREIFKVDYANLSFYFLEEKLKRIELEKSMCTTIEYSKEVDDSLLEFPKNYEIIDKRTQAQIPISERI